MFKKVLLIITALLVTNACGVNTSWEYLEENLPGKEPVIFARDIISTDKHEHSAPAISPNGDEIYWSVFENVNT